jgi:hypothetical protein
MPNGQNEPLLDALLDWPTITARSSWHSRSRATLSVMTKPGL